MNGWAIVAGAFRDELAKTAAEAKKKPAGAVEMPASPVAMENMSLQEQLDNLNLHMQLRQATQAWQAAQQQDAEQQAQTADPQQGGVPPGTPMAARPGMNPFMKNPAVNGAPTGLPGSPTEMIGAQ